MKKWLTISIIATILILLSLGVKLSIDNMYFQPHGYIKVVSVPETVSYSYHDTKRNINSGETKAIPVGKYEIIFSAEGFSDYQVSMDIKDDETKQVGVQLIPETEAAQAEHDDSKYDRNKEFDTSYRLDKETEQILAKNPIIDKLPILSKDYTAVQCEPYRQETIERGNIGICIQIIEPEKYQVVINQLSDADKNLDKYDILFNDEFTYPNKADREAGNTFTLVEPYDYGHGDEG